MNKALEWLLGISRADVEGTQRLSLRLTGLPDNLWLLLGLLALLGLLSWVVVRCYRGEGRAPAGAKHALAGLRIAVLLLLLLIVLQPALVARFVRRETAAVAVLLDDTLSMHWRDRYTDQAERAALAGAADLPAARLAGEDRPSRCELVRRVLLRPDGFLEKLADRYPLSLYRFGVSDRESAGYIEPLGETEPQAEAGKAAASAGRALGKLAAGGYHTDLPRAARELLHRLEGRRLAAVVVVSDGQNTGATRGGARMAGAGRVARQRGVPVYTVAVGNPRPPRNVMVAQLQGPREARQKSRLAFTAFVTQRLMPPTSAEVRLWRTRLGEDDWQDTGASAQVELGGAADPGGGQAGQDRALREVALSVEAPDAVGLYRYKARIEPLPEEMITDDNEAGATVRITDQKLKVLLISGDAGWEFQYLRNYLLKMSDHFAVSVWQQNADPGFNQEASTGMKLAALPSTRDELFAYDVILMHDPRAEEGMDAALLEMLESFAGQHHGGIAYLAGNKFTTRNLAPGGPFEALRELLPVVPAPRGSAAALRLEGVKEMSAIRVSPAGAAHPMTQLAPRAADNRRLWELLPGLYRSQPVARLKTLATALVVNGNPGRLTNDQQPEPLVAIQHYGKGRVVYLGFDSTWRWRSLAGAEHYERFWANAMDFLGQGRLEKKRILITTDGETFDAGSDIRVRVEAYDRDFAPLRSKTLTVAMRPAGGAEGARFTFEADKPGGYGGVIPADRVGLFELDAVADDSGQAAWLPEDVAVRRIEIRLPREELRRPETDLTALEELSGSPRRSVRLAEAASLADRIPAGVVTSTTEVTHPVWHSKLILILLGLLLLTEWTVRKIHHMM